MIIRPDLKVELGSILAVVSAITHAVAGLLVKRLSNDENVLTLMFSMVVLMAPITFIPSVYVWEEVDSFFCSSTVVLTCCNSNLRELLLDKSYKSI